MGPEEDRDAAIENEVMNVIPETDTESEPVVTSITATWEDSADELELTRTSDPESTRVRPGILQKQSEDSISEPEKKLWWMPQAAWA